MLAGLVGPGRRASAFLYPSLLTGITTAELVRDEAVNEGAIESFPDEATVSAGVNAPIKEQPTKESGLVNGTAGA